MIFLMQEIRKEAYNLINLFKFHWSRSQGIKKKFTPFFNSIIKCQFRNFGLHVLPIPSHSGFVFSGIYHCWHKIWIYLFFFSKLCPFLFAFLYRLICIVKPKGQKMITLMMMMIDRQICRFYHVLLETKQYIPIT